MDHSSLNVFSQMGIIMLIGLVTKNGILIVEFANQRKRAGLEVVPALYAFLSRPVRALSAEEAALLEAQLS
jgi:multidrug efflux pump